MPVEKQHLFCYCMHCALAGTLLGTFFPRRMQGVFCVNAHFFAHLAAAA